MLTEENRQERLTGIGASEIAGIVGLSPWSSPLAVYEAKVCPPTEEPESNEDMERGEFMESGILRWTAKRRGILIVPNDKIVRHPEHKFCLATPDGYEIKDTGRIIDPNMGTTRVATVEVKSPRSAGDRWHDPTEDPRGFPQHYLAQAEWQLLATGLPRGILSAVIFGRLWSYDIEADDDLQSALLEAGAAFWKRVEQRDPPPIESPGDVSVYARLFRQKSDRLVAPASTEDTIRAVREYMALRALAKEYEAKAEVVKGSVIEQIGENQGLDLGEHGVVRYAQSKDSTKVNWEKVAREAGASEATIAKYTKVVPGSRRFMPKLVGNGNGGEE